MPPANASQTTLQQTAQQVKNVLGGETSRLKTQFAKNALQPNSTPCGISATRGVGWGYTTNIGPFVPYKLRWYSEINYHILSASCSQAFFDSSDAELTQDTPNDGTSVLWDLDRYAGNYYGAGILYLTSDTYDFKYNTINQSATKGYTYETWMKDNDGVDFHWCDILVD